MTNYRYLGYGITNDNGIAKLEFDENGDPITHSYTGTGAGELDIIASLDDNTHISDSSILSEPYIVDDTIAFDLCVDNSHSSQWSHSDSNEVTVDSSGMLIDHNTTGLSTNTFKTPSASSNFCYTTPIMVEFDVVSVTSQVRVQFYDNTNLISLKLSEINAVAGSHVKLVMDNNSKICTAYVNDVQKLIRGTDTGTALSDYTFRFRLEDNSAFKFKNLKIYNTDSEDYAFFYDEATEGHKNTKWVNQSGHSTIQVLSTGTKITEGSTANNITPSSVANSTSWNDRLTFTSDFVVEFDVVSYENDLYLKIIHDNTSHQKVFNATGHYKITCSMTNGASYTIDDGTSISIYTGSMSNVTFAFATITTDTGVANITFKNFIVYPI